MAMEPLYKIKVACPYCEHEFETSRVRPSLKKAYRSDSDFCGYYKNENPDFYVVRVCPSCGFAFTEHSVTSLNDAQRAAFHDQVGRRWNTRDFGGARRLEEALETYKLALLCAQAIREKDRIVASLLQHIAWLYRYQNDAEQEQRFLEYSLEAYVRCYEYEGFTGNDARLLYLIGELNRRVGRYREAVQWFSRVVQDQKITDAAMIRASREQWALLREQMMAEGTQRETDAPASS
ncbi:DUF2225 domain-containing protein [Paenibacillus sp. F411]|uniref:DUF2225 domain-containing protein n=1 Tax=Paenibacillus algicola TaxID=2565926 RepID=A0A4P8XTW5_9BACL|nr:MULTISPECIES: DUF2225 domain-containing protein [Paenibacillus]MBO2943901.1 DUF2225 domain-containing protein [Paenibacillus sp. F411]QCT04199.1 Protein of unknown function DUF2225 [Paenibacillus algicola]